MTIRQQERERLQIEPPGRESGIRGSAKLKVMAMHQI